MNICAVILAAGLGTRMKSKYSKVLFDVAGEPMISHVIRAARKIGPSKIITVVGHSKELVIECVKKSHADYSGFEFVTQSEQKGTGHAVMQAREALAASGGGVTFVLCGDTPLLTPELFQDLLAAHTGGDFAATVLTTTVADPKGYGRIVRGGNGGVKAIVEERDADAETKRIAEINTGVYAFSTEKLIEALSMLDNDNDQHEYYLTDTIKIFNSLGLSVAACHEADSSLMMGINNRFELSAANRIMRSHINKRHMIAGVTIADPDSTYIDAGVEIENDVTIYAGTYLHGRTKIATGAKIGPMSYVIDSIVGENAKIFHSVVENSEIGRDASVGPYSHLRPQTKLCDRVNIGNYVEVKKSLIGEGSKANHLTYIGDAEIGTGCNIGAGTITCNYDGVNKHRTVIGSGAFIGSNTSLVAPVEIGEGSLVAAGSVVNKNVPAGALAIARSPLCIKEGYVKKRSVQKAEKNNTTTGA
jgi:bifunctional UDP-N-acetylglucosamine pyrophosphorylase/glucosamine-1-phosphate N-acetyltransferase